MSLLVLTSVAVAGVCDEKTVKPNPSDESVESLYQRAAALAIEGKYEAALPLYEKLLKMGSWEPESRGLHAGLLRDYGSCQIQVGKVGEALKTLQLVAEKYELLTLSGNPPDPIRRITLRAQIVGCLNALERFPEAKRELQIFDRFFADYEGQKRDTLAGWRKKVGEILSSK